MSSKIKVDTIEDVGGSSNITIGTNLTMDVAGDITLDAGGADVKLSDDGTNFLTFTKSSNDVTINTPISDGDISFIGNDGGSAITSMKMDMSAGGVVTIDPSNNLSTASGANAKLNVGSLSGTAGALNVNVAGTNGAGAYRLINATDGVTTNFLVKTDNSGSENRLELGPETASAICFEIQGNERMKINPAGQVTKPNNPAFLAYGSPTMTNTSGGHGYFHSFANSDGTAQSFDNGGHYNNSNGRFTAPVAGKYMFGLSIARGEAYNGGNQLIYVSKNSDASGGAHLGSNASASQASDQIQCHFIYNLGANDFVVPLYYNGSGTFTRMSTTPRNYFYGYLIG